MGRKARSLSRFSGNRAAVTDGRDAGPALKPSDFKAAFSLSYAKAMLVQTVFFAAYFIVSLPAGRLVSRVGYHRGIVIGLATAALGCSPPSRRHRASSSASIVSASAACDN